MKQLQFNSTQFAEDGNSLLYAKIGPGMWSIFHMDTETHRNPSQTGIVYPTKVALLADLRRFATESWGFNS